MKIQNTEIGKIICPICGDEASVRKNKNGRLYYVGKAGMITPNYRDGQEWMLQNATLHSPAKPAEKPVNGKPAQPDPVNESPPAPKPAAKPVNKESAVKRLLEWLEE